MQLFKETLNPISNFMEPRFPCRRQRRIILYFLNTCDDVSTSLIRQSYDNKFLPANILPPFRYITEFRNNVWGTPTRNSPASINIRI